MYVICLRFNGGAWFIEKTDTRRRSGVLMTNDVESKAIRKYKTIEAAKRQIKKLSINNVEVVYWA